MKKISVSLATIAMFFVAVNNANAATCTWNGTRRVKYTPAEAAAIVGDSNDNMIVMYFK